MTRLFTATALIALAAACSPADAPIPDGAPTGPVLSYTDAFMMQPVPGRDITMGGVTLSVEGGDVRIVGASSPSVDKIELHTMDMSGGTMRMRMVDGFDLADGGTLELKRGGNHFMMFGLEEDLVAGETIDIKVDLETEGEPMTLILDAEIRALGD